MRIDNVLHAVIARAVALAGLVALAACTPEPPGPARPSFAGVWIAFGSEAPGTASAAAPQLSSGGRAVVDGFYAQYTTVPDPGAYCVPNGMPGVMLSLAGYPIEILQSPERLTVLAELEMQLRRIYLDGRGHPADYPPTGSGHSIGRWDADTLVVDTALLSEWRTRPWPRTEQTRIEERIRLVKRADVDVQPNGFVTQEPIGDDVLVLELTLTDPALYAEPQRRTMYYQRIVDSATLEYDCTAELWLQALEKNRASR
jgi:hypothetical protein